MELSTTKRIVVGAAALLLAAAAIVALATPSSTDAPPSSALDWLLDKAGLDKKQDPIVCTSYHFSKMTVQVLGEQKFGGMLTDVKGSRKFEGSDVINVGSFYWVVFDSLWGVGKFAKDLPFYNPINSIYTTPEHPVLEESGFEAIVYNDKTGNFFLVQESIKGEEDGEYRAIVQEVKLKTDPALSTGQPLYENIGASCATSHTFEGDSKGLEGATGIWDKGEFKLLGLCEGNSCSETEGVKDDPGHGQVLLMRKETKDGSCRWKTEKKIDIPKTAFFTDYSAISLSPKGKVAITSQENATVWVGTWNYEKMEFGEGDVYNFPRNDKCQKIYCNVEGITWVDEDSGTLVTASDKMKGHGKQPFECAPKDQSMQLIQLP